jgi:predicted nuclease of predicted toxin-antitoxin system
MKILLDECLPVEFRLSLRGHEVHTVQWAGLKGKKNGELLQAAEASGYDVLVTVDQGIPRQWPLGGRRLSIILIRSRTNQMEDPGPLAPAILKALESIQYGQSIVIPFSG